MLRIFTLFFCLSFLSVTAQNTADTQLKSRLQDYLTTTRQLDFDKALDYMHPKLYRIVSKDAMLESMKGAFESEEMKLRFDSMAIIAIGPAVKFGKETYRKIDYYLSLTMTLSDSTNLREPQVANIMKAAMQNTFPHKKITIDTQNNALNITSAEIMFAIKDPTVTEWMFLGYDRSNKALVKSLYPAAVRQRFRL